MSACGECTKKFAFPLGAHCRQSWPSVATGLYRNTIELKEKRRKHDDSIQKGENQGVCNHKTFIWRVIFKKKFSKLIFHLQVCLECF